MRLHQGLNLLFLFIFLFSLLPIASAISIDNPNIPLVRNDPIGTTFDNNTAFVNSSQFWVTQSFGPLDDANSTQHNGDAETLSIDESWLISIINSFVSNFHDQDLNTTDNVTFNNVSVTEDLLVGDRVGVRINPVSILHVYEDTFVTDSTNGITIEQDGSGDAGLQWLLTGGQRWEAGVISGGTGANQDMFAIATGNNLANNAKLQLLTGGTVRVPTGPLLVGTSFVDSDAIAVFRETNFDGISVKAGSGPRIFFDEGTNGAEVETAFFGIQVTDDAFVMRQFTGSGDDILFAVQSGGSRISLGTQPFIFRHSGDFEMMTDGGKLFNGLAEDISLTFNGSARVANSEVGNVPAFWIDFLNYNFDNDTLIGGDLEVAKSGLFQGNVTIIDTLFLKDTNHFIKVGAEEEFVELANDTVWIDHKDEPGEGTIVFLVSSNKSNSDIHAVNIMAQIGRNNSAGVLGNSWMTLLNNLTDNLTIFSNCFLAAEELNETLRVHCDSSDTGPDFIVQDDIQAFGTVFADGGIRAETLVDFIMNGEDVNIENGSLHIFTPVTFLQGVVAGQEVTTFNEFFVGGLGSFTNLQSDLGNWIATTSIFCDDGDCANAIGISGVGNIIMEANISTTNINSTSLNFVYSLINMLGANSFTVTVNNNVGSGDVVLLTDSTNDVIKSSQSIAMPSSMSNQPLVSIRFECDVTTANRECFVDTISVNGTAIATTLTNQSGFDSVIKFSDGTLDANGFPLRGIIYNASGDEIIIRGNVSFENIIEQDLNVTNSISLNGTTIFDWADVVLSPFFPGYFLLNGSSVMAGNANFGGFNVENVGNISLGQIINFTLGETIDNLIDGWITITGSLQVTGDLNVTGNITLLNGGIVWDNSTCTFISSPDGSTILEVCDV